MMVRFYWYLILLVDLEKSRLLVDDLNDNIIVRIPLFGINSGMREAYKVHPKLERMSLVATNDVVVRDLMPEVLRQIQKVGAVAFECVDSDFGICFVED